MNVPPGGSTIQYNFCRFSRDGFFLANVDSIINNHMISIKLCINIMSYVTVSNNADLITILSSRNISLYENIPYIIRSNKVSGWEFNLIPSFSKAMKKSWKQRGFCLIM